jgi:hypothetical protein
LVKKLFLYIYLVKKNDVAWIQGMGLDFKGKEHDQIDLSLIFRGK